MQHFFVYGTLKSDQCRASCWPAHPLAISPATMTGALYDLGPYPAMTAGRGRVAGECWSIADADVAAVLDALDAIEGYSGDADYDLYTRVRESCQTEDGRTLTCWTYFYNRDVSDLTPRAGPIARWPCI